MTAGYVISPPENAAEPQSCRKARNTGAKVKRLIVRRVYFEVIS